MVEAAPPVLNIHRPGEVLNLFFHKTRSSEVKRPGSRDKPSTYFLLQKPCHQNVNVTPKVISWVLY